MNINEIPKGVALVVDVTHYDEIRVGNTVMLCIKCYVDKDGNLIPYNESLQLFRKELNDSIGNESLVIKRKHKSQFS